MLRLLQFLLFAYFYNSVLDSALQEVFCFYDFHVFQLSWLRSKIWKNAESSILQTQNLLNWFSEEFQIHLSLIYMLILDFEQFKILILHRWESYLTISNSKLNSTIST